MENVTAWVWEHLKCWTILRLDLFISSSAPDLSVRESCFLTDLL